MTLADLQCKRPGPVWPDDAQALPQLRHSAVKHIVTANNSCNDSKEDPAARATDAVTSKRTYLHKSTHAKFDYLMKAA